MGEAEERATDILDDISTREGELLQKDAAYPQIIARANSFFEEEAARFGNGPRAAEAALTRAYKEQAAYEKAVSDASIERHMNQLTNLSSAGHELAAHQSAPQDVVTEPGGDELSVVRKYGGFPGIGSGAR
jgi:hypothetical protein